MKNSVIIFALFAGLLFSCRPKNIDIDVKSADPKLVIFSQIVPDQLMLLMVTKSFSPLEGNAADDISNVLVSGAVVKLTCAGQTYDFIELNPGIYTSLVTCTFAENSVFEMTATKDGETVSSTSTVLKQANFISILPEVEKLPADTNVYLNVDFADDPNTPNWYMINVYKKTSSNNSTDINNFFQNGSNSVAKTILVSDKEFSTNYTSKIAIDNVYHNDSIVVTLSNINEKYFNFLGLRQGGGGVFSQLNLEPVNYPTNIVNGYGFFNTYIPDIKFYDLSQY